MKKLLLVVAVAAFTMTSCKKNYTCECTTVYGGTTPPTPNTVQDFPFKNTKSKAKSDCDLLNSNDGSEVTTCVIK